MTQHTTVDPIPLNRTDISQTDRGRVAQALMLADIAGPGLNTKACDAWLSARTGAYALTVNSGTAALELTCLLAGLQPGDEVIMPSFTFPSTANAVVLRNAVPVFVDIDPDTLNIAPDQIEAAITPRTRAIFVMHYAGVACDMDRIGLIAEHHNLQILEDAAHAVCAEYKGQSPGALGDFGAYSFHATKNISCGQGGAVLIRDEDAFKRAQILCEKGTNRSAFLRGETDKYTWQDVGANYRPNEISSALLASQLQRADEITQQRRSLWKRYHEAFADLEAANFLRRPIIPDGCRHNGHIYYVLMPDENERNRLIEDLKSERIGAAFHYVPLHLAPAGQKYARTSGTLDVTCDRAARLLRLPLHPHLTRSEQARVIEAVERLASTRATTIQRRA